MAVSMYRKQVGPTSFIEYETLSIGTNVKFGSYVLIRGNSIKIGDNVEFGNNTKIYSCDICIGERTKFLGDSVIKSYARFRVGHDSIIRPRAFFTARSIEIGNYFYSNDNPSPMIFGGGGSDRATARLKIGDRCVIHDSFINVCMPVTIGDDVGLSPTSSIITHGFWNNLLEGYGKKFAGVKIGNQCIIGYGAKILMGVELGDYCSVGAGAVVTKSFPSHTVVGGVPAKVIKAKPNYPKSLTRNDQIKVMKTILREYAELLKDKINTVKTKTEKQSFTIFGNYTTYGSVHGEVIIKNFAIWFAFEYANTFDLASFPTSEECKTIILRFNDQQIADSDYLINLTDLTWRGEEDELTDDLRNWLRKNGIRIFSPRGFRAFPSNASKKLMNRKVFMTERNIEEFRRPKKLKRSDINPLLVILSPRNISRSIKCYEAMTKIDRLWARFFDIKTVQTKVRDYVATAKHYTHIILTTDDVYPSPDVLDVLLDDILTYDVPIVAGCCDACDIYTRSDNKCSYCEDNLEHPEINVTISPIEYLKDDGERRYVTACPRDKLFNWQSRKRLKEQRIIQCWFQGNAMAVFRRDMWDLYAMKPYSTFYKLYSDDFALACDLHEHAIPQFVDLRAFMRHDSRFHNRLLVGKEKPMLIFQKNKR